MLYRPNRKETKQLRNLNKAYKMIKKAFDILIKNAPKKDAEIGMYIYRAGKNMNSIIKRTAELLEAQYIDKQFEEIVKNFDNNNNNNNKKGK